MAEPDHHIQSLDSLRGVAACVVVIGHALRLFPAVLAAVGGARRTAVARVLVYSPLHVFWDGDAAVVVFFVLSGYVLTTPFLRGAEAPDYPEFLLRRILRLYPAYAVAVLVAFAIGLARGQSIGVVTLVQHAVMYVTPSHNRFDPVIWSLVIEMAVSLLFPALVVVTLRAPVASLLTAMAVSLVVHRSLPRLPPETGDALWPILATATSGWLFALGIVLRALDARMSRWFAATGPAVHITVVVLGALMLSKDWIFPDAPRLFASAIAGLGAALVIAACRHARTISKTLENGTLFWIGRRSYSLYLIHFPLMLAMARVLPTALVAAILLPVSLATAAFLFALIEEPARRLGRKAGPAALHQEP